MNDSDLPFVNEGETIGKSPDKKLVEAKLRLLAGYIQQNTSCLFYDPLSGAKYQDVSKMDFVPEIKMQSLFNDWKYWNGVNHMAFMELANVLQDERFSNYVKNNYTFFFQNIPYLQQMFEARVDGAPGHQFFRLDRLDDFGAMASGLFDILDDDPRPVYKDYLLKVTDYIENQQHRLDDGTFCRNRFGYTSLWGDDLYMSVPFLVRAWRFFDDTRFLEDAVKQVFNFREYLFSPEKGIYYHSRIVQEGQAGVAFWGRANGWMVMALCQLLSALPEEHENRPELIDILKEHLTGVARYQTGTGMWRQLLDKNDSFPESSCTAMFVYGIAKAVNEGWISDIYASIAIRGWEALVRECIAANGHFEKVSTGFNFKQDLTYYYNVPYEPGGDHGIGAAIYAGIEIFKMKPTFRDCVWC